MVRFHFRLTFTGYPAITMPASALSGFVKAFPSLQILSLKIKDSGKLSSSSTSVQEEHRGIKRLNPAIFKMLDIGSSSLPEENVASMAEVLHQVCNGPFFEIEYSGKGNKMNGGSAETWWDVENLLKLKAKTSSGAGTDTLLEIPALSASSPSRLELEPKQILHTFLLAELPGGDTLRPMEADYCMRSDDSIPRSITIAKGRPMHRALAVHEILGNILRYAQKPDQARAARVSSLWCDVALDWVWRDIPSVLPLLRLLARLEETNAGLAFAERIERYQWERFRNCARRVRILNYDDSDPDHPSQLYSSCLSSAVGIALLALKPSDFGPLLPKIHEIQWSASHDIITLQNLVPFIHGHSSLNALKLHVGEYVAGDEGDTIPRFFDMISSIQGLVLERFTLQLLEVTTEALHSVASFIKAQSKLKTLDIPGPPSYILPTQSNIAQSLVYSALPATLEDLSVRVLADGPEDFNARMQDIVRQTPHLTSLQLLPCPMSWGPSSFDHFKPLLGLSSLENLTLLSVEGVQLDSNEGVSELGRLEFTQYPW
ncbi:hypothetical protein FRB90_001176 [Tulasnella sp. 427]|nr:hypothetical protein FRB90_001176 [Tulasnella sp. 427]